MKPSKIANRTTGNPNHHLWNNNGTWWLHYTEHLPDHTKRRIRISLHTHNVRAARAIRDVLLSWDAPQQNPQRPGALAA
jgi:hypothetical protein